MVVATLNVGGGVIPFCVKLDRYRQGAIELDLVVRVRKKVASDPPARWRSLKTRQCILNPADDIWWTGFIEGKYQLPEPLAYHHIPIVGYSQLVVQS